MTHWVGSIYPDQYFGQCMEHEFQVNVECGPNYPEQAPTVYFVQQVNMSEVDSKGKVRLYLIDVEQISIYYFVCSWISLCWHVQIR